MHKTKLIFKSLVIITLTPFFLCSCYDAVPIEELSLIVGIGDDLDTECDYPYSATLETLIFKGNNNISHTALTGKGYTLYTTQNDRQTKNSKEWLLADEIVYLISESRARSGIKDFMDATLRDANRNENAYIAITKQSTEKFFTNEPFYSTTNSEEIASLLQFSKEANFFYTNPTLMNMLLSYNQEGRKMALLYIELKEGRPQVTGLALFKGATMIEKISLNEARLINLLRNNKSTGYISINTSNKENYTDFTGKNSIKVKVSKQNNIFVYDIYVTLKGVLTVNSICEEDNSFCNKEKIQSTFEEKLEKVLYKEIQKMQQVYKTDWLDLGYYAVAKYGREKNVASDDNFCKSKINVHVNVKVTSLGRKSDK
ncbi:spore germination protein B3 precursor [Clostridium tepidiprofundi DSM 19306]|uniref:Spore germination protein B3 n=1 Tax=Clostridium tepidiprofundi DSM 19306 TaxID=1121338 RepID=A0A151B608_9CLOT|nr:Ger(x)C family spore germination protein [Clostridium tepidiprofundi]KYH35365.1 spore germination protein B3 precursor [Clostridium tepidiprofundi DSM 19306]